MNALRRLGLVWLLLLAGLACGRETAPAEPALDVLVVSFDALRADAVAPWGGPSGLTPAFSALAQESTVFTRAFAAAPVTPTSFAAMFSRRLPTEVFRGWQFRPARTLAEELASRGYATAAFLNNSQLTPERGFDRGWEHYEWFNSVADEEVFEAAVSWLGRSLPEPRLAWIHFLSPHSPYDYRAEAPGVYEPSYSGPFLQTTGASFESRGPGDSERIRSLYDGEVWWTDQLLGRLISWLEARDRLERTLLVVTADHGEEFEERGGFQHRWLYEETTRVPLLVRRPGVAALRDERPMGLQHLSSWLIRWLDDPQRAPPPSGPIVSVAMTDRTYRGAALREHGQTLIVNCHPQVSRELYDTALDPGERRDLASELPEAVERGARRLDEQLGGPACARIEQALRGASALEGLDSETRRGLASLGYAD